MTNDTTDGSSESFAYEILFRYQSQSISFPDWVTLLTVCLAPLVAHLVAGAPKVVYLHDTKPPWHETIVHYNPTSIIWRYFAITDRRIRARSWSMIDMAVGNALFWTPRGWDGSAEMAIKCRDICIRPPPPFLERMLSKDSLKTIIITMQGAQAAYLSSAGHAKYSGFALDNIFMPIAFIGLLRLPAALWLTDEYLFVDNESVTTPNEIQLSPPKDVDAAGMYTPLRPLLKTPTPTQSNDTISAQFSHGFKSLRGVAVRIFYISFLLAILTLCLEKVLPRPHQHTTVPLTVFLSGLLYVVLLLAVVAPLVTYSLRHCATAPSTVIPCASALWYKIFTCVLAATFVSLIIVAALETRKTPCGIYTSIPKSADEEICPNVMLVNTTTSS